MGFDPPSPTGWFKLDDKSPPRNNNNNSNNRVDHSHDLSALQPQVKRKVGCYRVYSIPICLKHLPVHNVFCMDVGKTCEYLCHEVSHCLQWHRGEGAFLLPLLEEIL